MNGYSVENQQPRLKQVSVQGLLVHGGGGAGVSHYGSRDGGFVWKHGR